MSLKVTLISHASVLIETADTVIWTDPWVTGRVFNESWALRPEPKADSIEKALELTKYVWISHEHPDHFNIPTLKILPEDFKRQVTVLFQHFPTNKMVDAFRRFGFKNIETLNHREFLPLSEQTSVYLYQAAPLDSALGVTTSSGHVLLNVNDCELSTYENWFSKTSIGGRSFLRRT